jgi:hypothetical protein
VERGAIQRKADQPDEGDSRFLRKVSIHPLN